MNRATQVIVVAFGAACFGAALGESMCGDGPGVYWGAALVSGGYLVMALYYEWKSRRERNAG